MRFVSRICPLLLSVVLATACDRTPSDPTQGAEDLAALLLEQAAGGRAAPHTLPALLQSAVERVYREQGAQAARALVLEVRRAQDQARASAGSDASLRRAVAASEIQVILRVFGERIVPAVISNVRDDAARLRADADALEAAGRPVPALRKHHAEAEELLVDAEAAVDEAPGPALDLATRAASALVDARAELAEATRVPTLSRFVDSATARLSGSAKHRSLLSRHQQLLLDSRVAVTGTDRDAAQKALEAVRLSEISVVLEVFGPAAPRTQLAQAGFALENVRGSLDRLRREDRTALRLARMHASARDLITRARAAFQRGDYEAALDLGSHAAGLLNSIRVSL